MSTGHLHRYAPMPMLRERSFTMTAPDPMVEKYATRLLQSQDVRQGNLYGDGPPTPLQVAAVLRGLADHTAIKHLLDVVAAQRAMAHPADSDFEPAAMSVGRYFQALAGNIEWQDFADRQANDQGSPSRADLLNEARAFLTTDPRITPERRAAISEALDSLRHGEMTQ